MFSFRRIVSVLVTVGVLVGIPATAGLALPGEPESWSQVGQALPGQGSLETWGQAVALNDQGTIVAVGGPGADLGAGPNQGQVGVFQLEGNEWVLLGAKIPGDTAGGFFGYSVALSANGLVLAVGAPQKATPTSAAGEVRVFDFQGGSWVLREEPILGSGSNENQGQSVALSADGIRLIIGSPGFVSGFSTLGRVRVWDWSGTGWAQVGADIVGPSSSSKFGESVDISANGASIVVGAPHTFSNPGSARAYSLISGIGTDTWELRGSPIVGVSNGDAAGRSVSMDSSGDTVLVGSPGGASAGSVRAFVFTAGSWVQRGTTVTDEAAGDKFGYSVSLASNGTGFIAGAPGNAGAGAQAGNARVFEYSGTDWTQQGGTLSAAAAGNKAGTAVAMSGHGTTVALGEPLHDQPLSDAGQVRVYSSQVASTEASAEGAGLPGIYLHVAGPVGRSVADSPVYYGAYRVKPGSAYALSVREVGASRAFLPSSRTLASGSVNGHGHLTGRLALPVLAAGDYRVTFMGTHATGTGLSLVATLRVGTKGEFVTLGSNLPGIW